MAILLNLIIPHEERYCIVYLLSGVYPRCCRAYTINTYRSTIDYVDCIITFVMSEYIT